MGLATGFAIGALGGPGSGTGAVRPERVRPEWAGRPSANVLAQLRTGATEARTGGCVSLSCSPLD
ncbi:hypothetical protein GCM10025734_24900 [Kitasatospora paranensis]